MAVVARAAAAVSVALALALVPGTAGAGEHDPRRTLRSGSVPLELVRPARGAGPPVFHEVAVGDNLTALAAAYGFDGDDGWRRLFDANPHVAHPDLLEVGTRVRIPAPGEEFPPREPPPGATARRGARPAAGGAAGGSVWDRLARCESGGNWQANTGNGYYGGLQFSLRSWQAVGGTGYPHEHPRATQVAMAERLRAVQGWGAWPACSRKLGLR